MFECPHMHGHPLYVWMPPYVWTPPVCLDNVWMPPYIYNTMKACFVTLGDCPYVPIHLYAPHVWTLPICLDAPICFNTLLYVWVMFGCPLYTHNT